MLNRTITLNPGQKVIVNSALLAAEDPEDEPLTYTLTAIPTAGELRRGDVLLGVGSTFTQADLDDISGPGLLSYTSTGTDPAADSFSFTVSDGTNALPAATVAISIVAPTGPISYAGGNYPSGLR